MRIINPTFPKHLMPGYYVCNTHRPEHGDGHWEAMRVNRCAWSGKFFDRYGHPPELYGLEGFLSRSIRGVWKFNNIPIQGSNSFTCGHHCIMYCVLSLGGVPLEKYVTLFAGKSFADDRLVLYFVRRLSQNQKGTPSSSATSKFVTPFTLRGHLRMKAIVRFWVMCCVLFVVVCCCCCCNKCFGEKPHTFVVVGYVA